MRRLFILIYLFKGQAWKGIGTGGGVGLVKLSRFYLINFFSSFQSLVFDQGLVNFCFVFLFHFFANNCIPSLVRQYWL